MTTININAMNSIVDELAAGKTISDALSAVYYQRNVRIPFNTDEFDVSLFALNMSHRTRNAIMRNRVRTINDAVRMNEVTPIKEFRGCGKDICTELFESILNYCWDHMSEDEKLNFLIDVVESNSAYLK